MARNNKRIDKPKNTRRKHTEYERHERPRFDVQAQVTSWPRVAAERAASMPAGPPPMTST